MDSMNRRSMLKAAAAGIAAACGMDKTGSLVDAVRVDESQIIEGMQRANEAIRRMTAAIRMHNEAINRGMLSINELRVLERLS